MPAYVGLNEIHTVSSVNYAEKTNQQVQRGACFRTCIAYKKGVYSVLNCIRQCSKTTATAKLKNILSYATSSTVTSTIIHLNLQAREHNRMIIMSTTMMIINTYTREG